MFGTHSLGRLFGVEVRLHGTVLLLALVLGLSSLASGGLGAAVGAVAILGLVLGSVTLHELGHIAMARVFGIRTSGITLYPFGGVASLTRPTRSGLEEVLVALAGPAVNVVLAVLAVAAIALLGALGPLTELLYVNAGLFLFNLLPAYPMDGGRVLRGLLWLLAGERDATRWAARTGQVMAVGMGIAGLLWNPMLLLVAFVVFSQATGELARLGPSRGEAWAGDGWAQAEARPDAPRPFVWPGAPDPFHRRGHVTIHTPSGVWEQWTLPDGRVLRRQVA